MTEKPLSLKPLLISFALAILLTLLPMPALFNWMKPLWVMMVLLYWIIALDYRVGIYTAFCLGILLDIFGGSLIGMHALPLIMVSYLAEKLQRPLRLSPILQKSLAMGCFAFIYLLCIYLILGLTDNLPKASVLFWSPIITTAIIYPWIDFILRKYHE
jgi:rod shape-determining protein MreD